MCLCNLADFLDVLRHVCWIGSRECGRRSVGARCHEECNSYVQPAASHFAAVPYFFERLKVVAHLVLRKTKAVLARPRRHMFVENPKRLTPRTDFFPLVAVGLVPPVPNRGDTQTGGFTA